MDSPITLRFTIDRSADIDDLLEDDTITQVISQPDCYQVRIEDADEALVESLNPDELAEFYGIDAEYLIAVKIEG
jgi:hypothetical protein